MVQEEKIQEKHLNLVGRNSNEERAFDLELEEGAEFHGRKLGAGKIQQRPL